MAYNILLRCDIRRNTKSSVFYIGLARHSLPFGAKNAPRMRVGEGSLQAQPDANVTPKQNSRADMTVPSLSLGFVYQPPYFVPAVPRALLIHSDWLAPPD
jgi:hypothetical protein